MIKYDIYKFTTVFIENVNEKGDNSVGTGFFVGFNDKPTVLVTANHVVKNADYLNINFHYIPIGSTHVATVQFKCNPDWKKADNYDICYCDLSKINKEFEELIGFSIYYKYISGDSILMGRELKNIEVLNDVIILGYPGGMKNTVFSYPLASKGTLATPLRDNCANDKGYVNVATVGGYSGSPVMLKTDIGYVLIGILTQALMENSMSSSNIGIYVDAYRLLDLV